MATDLDWTPPPGMDSLKVRAWRAFYAAIYRDYGITPDDYRLLYVAQKGRCWICRGAKGIHPDDPKARGSRRLGVDHNHAIGPYRNAVRGLLCTGGDKTCNRIIGWLNADQLRRAARHLEQPPGPWVLTLADENARGPRPATFEDLAAQAQHILWPAND